MTEKSLYQEYKALIKGAKDVSNFKACVIRSAGERYVFSFTFPTETSDRNYRIFERIIKSVIWIAGGTTIEIEGYPEYVTRLNEEYSKTGARKFDYEFMKGVFKDFSIRSVGVGSIATGASQKPKFKMSGKGRRIGFDAGGSDRKTCAIKDGQVVYSEEVVWHPKTCADYTYHKNEIKTAIEKARLKLGGVDYIGVSTAGIVIDGDVMVSSLFKSIPTDDFDKHVKSIYKDIAQDLNAPVYIANDGDVAALSGLGGEIKGKLVSIALGTSEAGGYVNRDGQVTGMLNELAFVPIYSGDDIGFDEWSGDFGCGASYMSQESIIRLAKLNGIELDDDKTPAEKLIAVRDLFDKGDVRAKRVFETQGNYIADALAWYTLFYDYNKVLILGRVVSGEAGLSAINCAVTQFKAKYPDLDVQIIVPKESEDRRLLQCYTAAKMQGK